MGWKRADEMRGERMKNMDVTRVDFWRFLVSLALVGIVCDSRFPEHHASAAMPAVPVQNAARVTTSVVPPTRTDNNVGAGLAPAPDRATARVAPTQTAAVPPPYAGELFGVKVPLQNYNFVKAGIMIFGNKWGAPVRSDADLEKATWDQLLLSFIAFNENIAVIREEINVEITKTLAAENVSFDWKKDAAAYESWVKTRTSVSARVFEEEIRHLLQIEKLRAKILDAMNPPVTEDEARQKFLNEHNSLSVELAQAANLKEAENFYKRVQGKAKLWDARKHTQPQDFKRPGFVSLEFLIDLWKIPADACYAMMQRNAGDIYPPRPIYKGYAVFKVLEKKPADEAGFTSAKDAYVEKVRNQKRYQWLDFWFNDAKAKAQIKSYPLAAQGEQKNLAGTSGK